jgi:hypothetical protein
MQTLDAQRLFETITGATGVGETAEINFLKNLHVDGVKADVMIRRFTARSLHLDDIDPAQAKQLTEEAAGAQGDVAPPSRSYSECEWIADFEYAVDRRTRWAARVCMC